MLMQSYFSARLYHLELMTSITVDVHPHVKQSDLKVGDIIDRPNWFALCTKPKQEDRACSNLESWGVECFNPKIQKCQRNPFTGIGTLITKPLFPRYFFPAL